jgi:hypothetical protein
MIDGIDEDDDGNENENENENNSTSRLNTHLNSNCKTFICSLKSIV